MKKNILIIGGKRKAEQLAKSLLRKKYNVTIINNNEKDCKKLSDNEKINVFIGDGTKPYVLEDVNAQKMDMAISLLPHDEDNLVALELCKKKFNIKKTISLLTDSKKIEFFHKMGVDKVVCSVEIVTEFIEQEALLDKISKSIPLAEGIIEILEVDINTQDKCIGKKIIDINLPKDVIIGCILRNGLSLVPRGDTIINKGDLLVLIIKSDKKHETMLALKGDRYNWEE